MKLKTMTTALAVALLVGRLGDHGDDATIAQMGADRARRVRLIGADPLRSGAWSARADPGDAEVIHEHREHRRIPGLTGTNEHDQRKPAPVDEVMDLRAQTTP